MKLIHKSAEDFKSKGNYLVIIDSNPNWSKIKLPRGVKNFISERWTKKTTQLSYHTATQNYAFFSAKHHPGCSTAEDIRRIGVGANTEFQSLNYNSVNIINMSAAPKAALLVAEGFALSSYQFLKYKSKQKKNKVSSVRIIDETVTRNDVDEMKKIVGATFIARDFVNEPLSYLTAVQYAKDLKKHAEEVGIKTTTFHKEKIKALKMGGLLAVNKGSQDPPTFNILEWKPKDAINQQPIVLVGKGVVYDTGGLSLKPTANSMDIMKCDMAGSAAAFGGIYAVAANQLPIHVICLIPATDNRPGENAYAPGDVITMHSGKTVEVLNTDAEGRMILADALSYAQQYDPELVIDLATLTGAAVAAIGQNALVAMGNDKQDAITALQKIGAEIHERVAEMPFWEDYGELLKSDIADIKNIGGPYAGSITAGKFLEHFTNYPWVHLDIAGPFLVK